MIPVTTFAGKKVAVFGLGGSGLVSASALLAGGADVVAFDDDAQSVAKANAAGIPTADLRDVDWSKIAALVLAPGVPLTHPAPHWIVALAHKAGVAVIGDIELFCRERAKLAPGAPFVAITGTNGKSTTTALIAHLAASAGMDAQLGGNIGTAILSLQPPLAGRVHVIECSSYQIDLAPSLDPSVGILINLSEDHLDRHGTMAHYAEVKERLVAGVPSNGTAIVGVDDDWCRAIADRLEQAGKRVVRISVRQELSDRHLCREQRIMRATPRGRHADRRARRHRLAARPAQCAERRLRRRRGTGARPRTGGHSGRAAFIPGPRPSDGRARPPRRRSLRQRFQSHQCRLGGPGAGLLQRHFLDCRRQAEDRRHRVPCAVSSPASARPT